MATELTQARQLSSRVPLVNLVRSRGRRTALLFGLPVFVLLAVLIGWPVLDGFLISLQRITPTAAPGWIGIANYKSVLTDGVFWDTVGVTLIFSVISLVVEFSIGLTLALMLARVVRGAGIIRTLILIPVMLTPAVAAINFRIMLNYDYGLINYLMEQLGFKSQAWVSESGIGPMLALIMTDVWRSTPFFVLVLSSGLLALPHDIIEAADIDGASTLRRLIFVKLPLLFPLVLVTILFRIIDLFRTFDIVFVLTQGGPGTATTVTSLQVYNDLTVGNFTSYASTEAMVFLVLTLFVSVFLIRILRRQD